MKNIKLKPFLETAHAWASNSSCCRVHVGAVIFNMKTKRLLSIGYNGTLSGQVHCDELFDIHNSMIHIDIQNYIKPGFELNNKSGWSKVTEKEFKELHHRFSELYEVHAEQNAIYNLIKTGASCDTDNLAIITTVEPCEQCAKAIAALGIKHVFYEVAYDRNTINMHRYLEILGVDCKQVESNGESL